MKKIYLLTLSFSILANSSAFVQKRTYENNATNPQLNISRQDENDNFADFLMPPETNEPVIQKKPTNFIEPLEENPFNPRALKGKQNQPKFSQIKSNHNQPNFSQIKSNPTKPTPTNRLQQDMPKSVNKLKTIYRGSYYEPMTPLQIDPGLISRWQKANY